MQEVLDQVRAVLRDYKPGQVSTVQQLYDALSACREFIERQEETDRGLAQRLVRELDVILSDLPEFRHLGDKQSIASRHTRRLAEEHLAELQVNLQQVLDADRKQREEAVKEWARSHKVFGQLRKICSRKKLPRDTYVLLFHKPDEVESPQLLPRSEEQDAVLTRFRTHAFLDDVKLNARFADVNVVGAAVVGDSKLIEAIGELPPPSENKDQLRTVLSLSNEAAGRPARHFVEQNIVLKTLHHHARKRQIAKDAYILLFRANSEIVVRKNEEGKVLTRFWSNDFTREYLLFENFRDDPPLVGAAVVKERELLESIGELPEPKSGQSQLDAVLAASHSAVQRPSEEFVANNEILNSLNQLANSETAPHKTAYVLLFSRAANGSIIVVSSKLGTRIPLQEFRSARALHQTFADSQGITGASVIAEGAKPHVVAAFGRTPLKESMLAVPENFRRLGITV